MKRAKWKRNTAMHFTALFLWFVEELNCNPYSSISHCQCRIFCHFHL